MIRILICYEYFWGWCLSAKVKVYCQSSFLLATIRFISSTFFYNRKWWKKVKVSQNGKPSLIQDFWLHARTFSDGVILTDWEIFYWNLSNICISKETWTDSVLLMFQMSRMIEKITKQYWSDSPRVTLFLLKSFPF